MNKEKNLKKIPFLITLALTIPLGLLIIVVYYTIINEPYSLPLLLRNIFLLSCFLIWINWWIIRHNWSRIKIMSSRIFSFFSNVTKTNYIKFLFIFLILTLGILLTINEFYFKNYLLLPNFKYHVELGPTQANRSNICIIEINNSAGNVFNYNETIRSAQNSGLWKRNVYGCEHYLDAGAGGKIFFENIGRIDDSIEIVIQSNPRSSSFYITSKPGFTKIINTWFSEKSSNKIISFKPGGLIASGFLNLGLSLGCFSFIFIIFLLIPESLLTKISEPFFLKMKLLFQNKIEQLFESIRVFLDSDKRSILIIFLLYFLGVAYSFQMNNSIDFGPTHFNDEIRYWETARTIYERIFILNNYYRSPPLYPISLLPAFYLFYPSRVYLFSRLLNSLYLTSAIFPAFIILKRITTNKLSLIAIAIMILNPVQIIMPGRILSENIFYPLLFWAILFAFTNVWPTNRTIMIVECLIFGFLLGFLFLTRYIALALIPALLLIWWLRPFNNEKLPFLFSLRKAFHFIIILIPLLVIIGGWVSIGTAEGLRAKDMLGLFIAESPNPGQLNLYRLAMWTVFYGSYVILIAAPFLYFFIASFMHFDIKNWQGDKNRWIIVITILTFCLLAACIRHSWRINYNFPIPLKIQGRYLLYCGPLFLITIFSGINQKFKPIIGIKLVVFSSLLILVSYAFLFEGFIFLDGPLQISRSSPDGDLIEAMGILFVMFSIANVFLSAAVTNISKQFLISSQIIFLIVFFTFGINRILFVVSNSGDQLENSQIYHLVQLNRKLSSDIDYTNNFKMALTIPSSSKMRKMRLYNENLRFNGFTDVDMRLSNINEIDSSLVFQAKINNNLINLRNISKAEFNRSNKYKYTHSGKYFEFQLQPIN